MESSQSLKHLRSSINKAGHGEHSACGSHDSVGYRVNGGAWKLYSKPLSLPKSAILEAKSVRYGWAESPVISFSISASD